MKNNYKSFLIFNLILICLNLVLYFNIFYYDNKIKSDNKKNLYLKINKDLSMFLEKIKLLFDKFELSFKNDNHIIIYLKIYEFVNKLNLNLKQISYKVQSLDLKMLSFNKVTFNISLVGNYKNIYEFIMFLEKLHCLYLIENFKLSSELSTNENVLLEVSYCVYVFNKFKNLNLQSNLSNFTYNIQDIMIFNNIFNFSNNLQFLNIFQKRQKKIENNLLIKSNNKSNNNEKTKVQINDKKLEITSEVKVSKPIIKTNEINIKPTITDVKYIGFYFKNLKPQIFIEYQNKVLIKSIGEFVGNYQILKFDKEKILFLNCEEPYNTFEVFLRK